MTTGTLRLFGAPQDNLLEPVFAIQATILENRHGLIILQFPSRGSFVIQQISNKPKLRLRDESTAGRSIWETENVLHLGKKPLVRCNTVC